MTMTLEHDLIQSVELVQVEKNKFALHGNDKIFFVGEMLFDIFKFRKAGKEIEEIYDLLQTKYKQYPSVEKIEEVLEQNIDKIFKQPAQKDFNSKSKYIYGQIRIIPEHVLANISNTLNVLFNRYLFIILNLAGGYWTFLLVKNIFMRGLFDSRITLKDGIFLFIISYVFLFFVSMFHEFGHSSAAARFGIRAKEIGFGFYLIFPVLYTDVTKVWLLGRYKRIVVNVGGIYFQLLLNIVLYFAFTFFKEYQNVVSALFLTNTTLALYSLNPIMRNDGYWIYSDLFDIPNLSKTAFDYPIRAYQYLKGKRDTFHTEGIITRGQKIALFIYAFVMYSLLILLPLGFANVSVYNFKEIALFVQKYPELKGIILAEQLIHIVKLIFFYCLTGYFTIRMFRGLIQKFRVA
jgi:putative peptide zinc metalloprotease protein